MSDGAQFQEQRRRAFTDGLGNCTVREEALANAGFSAGFAAGLACNRRPGTEATVARVCEAMRNNFLVRIRDIDGNELSDVVRDALAGREG